MRTTATWSTWRCGVWRTTSRDRRTIRWSPPLPRGHRGGPSSGRRPGTTTMYGSAPGATHEFVARVAIVHCPAVAPKYLGKINFIFISNLLQNVFHILYH